MSATSSSTPSSLTLAQFFSLPGQLTPDQRKFIIDQAIELIHEVYTHRPVKEALFAQYPVRRLEILRRDMDDLAEITFHYMLLDIFNDLHDIHTRYTLPTPYQSYVAYLPFSVAMYYENGVPAYLVSELLGSPGVPGFAPGVQITTFNGVPIEGAVAALQRISYGANWAALHARAVQLLTLRHLAYAFAPDASEVTVGYIDSTGSEVTITLPWTISPSSYVQNLMASQQTDPLAMIMRGDDAELSAMQEVKQELRSSGMTVASLKAEHLTKAGAPVLNWGTSQMPGNFSFATVSTPVGQFGYVAIATFNNTIGMRAPTTSIFVQKFHDEFLRILSLLPPNGLILDVRNNGGGIVPAGEGMLQYLSPHAVETCRYHFLNTPVTLEMCSKAPASYSLGSWAPSIKTGLLIGSQYSAGFGFLPYSDDYNTTGQRYFGPIVLLTNALCYSTTDMFTAAFQDNEIGTIIGVDTNTGAGGANVWDASAVDTILSGIRNKQPQSFPLSSNISLAVRRSTRVGKNSGVPIEDLGIEPDVLHQLTKDDLLYQNADLLAQAVSILAKGKPYTLQASVAAAPGGGLTATVTTKNLTRVDCYADDRPLGSSDVVDGAHTIPVPAMATAAKKVDLQGFDGTKLVAMLRVKVTAGG